MLRDRMAALRGRGLRTLAGRAGWGLADQVVTSASNLLVSVLAARALSAEGFGAFAVAFTVYTFFIAGGRALVSRPLTVRYAGATPVDYRAAAQAATGATLLLGVGAGIVLAVVGVALGGTVGTALLCIGALMPGLLLQDMWRMVFITAGRPKAAFINDAAWGIGQIAFVSAFIAVGLQSAATLLIGWGGSAVLVAVLGAVQFRGRPTIRASLPWVAAQRDLLKYYAISFIAVTGAYQITMLSIAGLGTPADVGALRAAQIVLGPLNLLGYALSAFVVPEIARRKLSGRRALQVAAVLSGLLVTVNVLYGAAALLLPDAVGRALLGDTWNSAEAVLPAALVGLVAISSLFGAHALLVALGYAKQTFHINVLLAPGFVVFGLTGLQLGGAPGAALGLALAQVVVVPVTWRKVVVLMRQRGAEGAEGAEDRGGAEESRVLDPAQG